MGTLILEDWWTLQSIIAGGDLCWHIRIEIYAVAITIELHQKKSSSVIEELTIFYDNKSL